MFDNKNMFDSAAGRSIGRKTINNGFKLLNEMNLNHKQCAPTKRETPARAVGMYEIDHLHLLLSKVEALSLKIDNMHTNTARFHSSNSFMCELCGTVEHTEVDCHVSIEQACYVNYCGQTPPNDPHSNSYNTFWRNHPNFSYRNNQVQNPPPIMFQYHPLILPELLLWKKIL